MNIPKKYAWLDDEKSPRILNEALRHYGVKEFDGNKNNPLILDWARELGLSGFYTSDSIPWCGLFMALVATRAGWDVPKGVLALRAREWEKWGNKAETAMLGDVLVFARKGGGHVGLYVGENKTSYYVLGANQNNEVNIITIDKKRCVAVRRSPWKVAQPSNVRQIFLDTKEKLSHNEA